MRKRLSFLEFKCTVQKDFVIFLFIELHLGSVCGMHFFVIAIQNPSIINDSSTCIFNFCFKRKRRAAKY